MRLLPVLALISACSWGDPAPTAAAPKGAAPAAAASPAQPFRPAAKVQATAPAPSRAWMGLQLGQSDQAALEAWVAERQLPCTGAPSPMRETWQLKCAGQLPASTLPDRQISGGLTDLLFVRTDAGPLHHVSSMRRYTLPPDAVADYTATVAALTATFGPPTVDRPVTEPEKLQGALARWATEWAFTDLTLRVTLMKGSGDYVSVSELWEIPGVEAAVAARPGAKGHGAQAPAKNPHIAEEPAPAGQPG